VKRGNIFHPTFFIDKSCHSYIIGYMNKHIIRFLPLCIVLFSFALPLQALAFEDLSPENQQQYLKTKLTVKVGHQSDPQKIDPHSFNWEAYKGQSLFSMDHSTFFSVTGNKPMAEEASKFEVRRILDKTLANWIATGGATVVVTGGVLLLLNTIGSYQPVTKTYADSTRSFEWGIVGVGAAIALASVPFYIRAGKKQKIEVSVALGIANDYNTRLLESLK